MLIKSKIHGTVAEPALPRWKGAPQRYEIGEGHNSFPETAKDYYKRIYFEALDVLIAEIAKRFNQTGFLAYGQLESLLLKSLKGEDISIEMKIIETNYGDDLKDPIFKCATVNF